MMLMIQLNMRRLGVNTSIVFTILKLITTMTQCTE